MVVGVLLCNLICTEYTPLEPETKPNKFYVSFCAAEIVYVLSGEWRTRLCV